MSDIHGFSDAFVTALDKVDLSGQNKLILLGDYMDYGPNSRKVIEIIIKCYKSYKREDKYLLDTGSNYSRIEIEQKAESIQRHYQGYRIDKKKRK